MRPAISMTKGGTLASTTMYVLNQALVNSVRALFLFVLRSIEVSLLAAVSSSAKFLGGQTIITYLQLFTSFTLVVAVATASEWEEGSEVECVGEDALESPVARSTKSPAAALDVDLAAADFVDLTADFVDVASAFVGFADVVGLADFVDLSDFVGLADFDDET
ncbi:hypothetical protein BCR39DRAFT_520688 [Naematelia encephala]|uniref:Uncharacterized protein n=1 Tax=Naematelia encephala TaxID=71784 RepID=A0A1Y2BDU1_9TREE|nr:hypothetical protein BCR39DRAFT_520688 [Naematelia encephala]